LQNERYVQKRNSKRNSPALIICDLHSEKLDLISLARTLKSDPGTEHIALLGFFSHVHTDLQRAAEEAGFDRVLPRSAFTTHLAEIIAGERN
jgi:CheY-like chemotaxis protein